MPLDHPSLDPQDDKTRTREKVIALGIANSVMASTVDFDDELAREACKIGDVKTDRMLTRQCNPERRRWAQRIASEGVGCARMWRARTTRRH